MYLTMSESLDIRVLIHFGVAHPVVVTGGITRKASGHEEALGMVPWD